MQRAIMNQLVAWKNSPNRKPLLLQGARQTGKTWIMETFAREQYADYVLVDFMMDERMRSLFEENLDPLRIISQLELLVGKRIEADKTLLIFDEIQEAPRGLTSLKYFCERAPQYHVIAAGSYMGIALRREGESFPVGKVDRIILRPMGFVEFLRAVAGDPMADALESGDFAALANLQDVMKNHLREYFIVGGMPEVVESFRDNADFTEARRLQLQILQAYEADFAKHAPARIVERMRLAWRSLPGQLAKENKKFIYGAVRPGGRARDFEECLQWLVDYGAVRKVRRVSALRMPLASYEDANAFKLFCCDVGLLSVLSGVEPATVLDDSRLFTEFKGSLTEQYVAQELALLGHEPVYWSSEKGDAETDFCIAAKGMPIPVEVKAGENLKSKSLKVACEKFGLERAVRTSLSPLRDEGWLVNIPLWGISQIDKLA